MKHFLSPTKERSIKPLQGPNRFHREFPVLTEGLVDDLIWTREKCISVNQLSHVARTSVADNTVNVRHFMCAARLRSMAISFFIYLLKAWLFIYFCIEGLAIYLFIYLLKAYSPVKHAQCHLNASHKFKSHTS